jgi:hypothetical protein
MARWQPRPRLYSPDKELPLAIVGRPLPRPNIFFEQGQRLSGRFGFSDKECRVQSETQESISCVYQVAKHSLVQWSQRLIEARLHKTTPVPASRLVTFYKRAAQMQWHPQPNYDG